MLYLYSGSSPRMRGALHAKLKAEGFRRFIPAHAGSTYGPGGWPLPLPVHPRACGEHARLHWWFAGTGGSSPRMRGARDTLRLQPLYVRFIPAHAGSTPFVIPCGPWCYRPCKSVPILRGKINTTLHLPLARRIQGAGRPDLQVSCDSCQRFQIRNPHHWGKSRR